MPNTLFFSQFCLRSRFILRINVIEIWPKRAKNDFDFNLQNVQWCFIPPCWQSPRPHKVKSCNRHWYVLFNFTRNYPILVFGTRYLLLLHVCDLWQKTRLFDKKSVLQDTNIEANWKCKEVLRSWSIISMCTFANIISLS